MIVTVSNSAELTKALSNAAGGETIVLKAGQYGDFSLSGKVFASKVTIISEDATSPAVFSGFRLKDVSNLSVSKVVFDYEADNAAPLWVKPFELNTVSNVAIMNCKFVGDEAAGLNSPDDGFGTGIGLSVRSSNGVIISGNKFDSFHRGLAIGQSTDVKVIKNDLQHMSSDGMNFADVDRVLIKGNKIHDFELSPESTAHPDMIQFWTSGTTSPSTDIRILNNFLYQGDGVPTQSIFMRNERVDTGSAGLEMYYQNIVIAGNVIKNGHYHGITVGETKGLQIYNNTVLQQTTVAEGASVSAPSINVALPSTGVSVHDNIVPRLGATLVSPKSGWIVNDNVIVQIDNPRAANYIGHIFADALDTKPEWSDFTPLEGTPAHLLGAGAVLPAGSAGAVKGWGYISAADTDTGAYLGKYLELSKVIENGSELNLTGAVIKWNFGDGTIGSGLAVGHIYEEPGDYVVSASVTLGSGKTLRIEKTVSVQGRDHMNLDFENGFSDGSTAASPAAAVSKAAIVAKGSSHALDLDGGYLSFDTGGEMVFNPEFTIMADFKKDPGAETSGGWLLYKSGSFNIAVGRDGVTANLVTSKGVIVLTATGLNLEDTDWHKLAVTFSGETGIARLMLDGKVVDRETNLTGAVLAGSPAADFYVGSPFGGAFTGMVDNVHVLGDELSVAAVRARDSIAAWMAQSALDPLVASYLSGADSIQLSTYLDAPGMADAFSNSFFGLSSNSDFQII